MIDLVDFMVIANYYY